MHLMSVCIGELIELQHGSQYGECAGGIWRGCNTPTEPFPTLPGGKYAGQGKVILLAGCFGIIIRIILHLYLYLKYLLVEMIRGVGSRRLQCTIKKGNSFLFLTINTETKRYLSYRRYYLLAFVWFSTVAVLFIAAKETPCCNKK